MISITEDELTFDFKATWLKIAAVISDKNDPILIEIINKKYKTFRFFLQPEENTESEMINYIKEMEKNYLKT